MDNRNAAAPLTELTVWRALAAHADDLRGRRVASLFDADPERFRHFSIALDDLLLDLSRHPVTSETRDLLLELARLREVPERIEDLFRGERVNASEGRPALHTALRLPADASLVVDGEDVVPAVHAELHRMDELVQALHRGEVSGFDGRPITDVVNIGIGGSDLGSAMAVEALAAYHRDGPRVHFTSSVDGRDLSALLQRLDPAATLFVVASKSFTTLETLTQARQAWAWVAEAGDEQSAARHFLGISASEQAMAAFGIPEGRRLHVWDWVGGRYSLASAMGFTLAVAVGMDRFREMLAGMHAMDRHFREAPLKANLPVMMGLLMVWHTGHFGATGHAVLPYHPSLGRLPAYLQQLDMESLGKSVTQSGEPVDYPTGGVLWGEVGSNAQHSFFQWLHQGTGRAVVEMLVPYDEDDVPPEHRDLAMASALGQASALMCGQSAPSGEANAEHRYYPGNRPVTLLLFRRLDPYTLGQLVALHEHRVFVQSVIWDINPFDQWGVELGKRLAGRMVAALRGDGGAGIDAAAQGALEWTRSRA